MGKKAKILWGGGSPRTLKRDQCGRVQGHWCSVEARAPHHVCAAGSHGLQEVGAPWSAGV